MFCVVLSGIAIAVLCSPLARAHSAEAADAKPAAPVIDDAAYRDLVPTIKFFRDRSAKEYAIDSVRGIDEASFVPIGGIEQWVKIRGQDRNNPVLLFLHGGPGDSTSIWSLPYFLSWEQHFTIVQWDQRGAGKTYGRSGESIASTVTLERMTQDGIELSEYLTKHLGKRKIILVAHSFGTLLGLGMIQQRPDLYLAYAGTGQVADATRSYTVAYMELLKRAEALRNVEAVSELKAIGPPPYASYQGYSIQRKWSNRFEGADRFLPGTIGLALQAPGYDLQDLDDSLAGQLFSGKLLFSKTRFLTMKDLGLSFKVPVFFFEGTEDFTTPTGLARKYLATLQAPTKDFVPISGGHFAVFIHSDEFLKQLIIHVLPIVAKEEKSAKPT